MMFKKVMLIFPFYEKSRFSVPVFPVGLGYIAEYLKENGVTCKIIDMAFVNDFLSLQKEVLEFKPDLIGFSMMSFMYINVYKLMNRLKTAYPDIKIAAGGPHISSSQEKILKDCDAIDFGIIGEGEETMLDLVSGADFKTMAGLIYKENGEIISNGLRPGSDDLDKFPFPKFIGMDLSKYGYGISIVSSRGCQYKCIYCTAHILRKKIRGRSAKNVADEIEYWYKKGYREFGFQEDNLAFKKSRLFKLCDEIETRDLKDLIMMCGNGVRADCVNFDLLKRMKEVGFQRLAFGVESGSEKVLKIIKKGEKLDVIRRAVKDACDLNFFVSLFFIVGSPGETYEDVEMSMDFAMAFPVSQINFYNLLPLPETELYKFVEENNYFLRDPDEYLNSGSGIQDKAEPVFETPEFPKSERIRAFKAAKRVERLIKMRSIEEKMTKIYPLSKAIAWLYTEPLINKIENQLLYYELYRQTVGKLRLKVRSMFYK